MAKLFQAFILLALWRTFFVSFVIQIGHVREHAPSFHSLLPRNCIQLAAKNVSKYGWLRLTSEIYFVRWARALSRVCSMRLMTVMGPTPPGTGVMKLARSDAGAKSTSP